MTEKSLPVIIVGAGPVGLTAALGLTRYGVDVLVFEEDGSLSLDTKAGTLLTRTIETLHRYDAVSGVLGASMRIDEIGEVDRVTNEKQLGVDLGVLADETRFPYALNIPQHHIEPILKARLDELASTALHMRHRLTSFEQFDDHVDVTVETPDGPRTVSGSYLIACDGGRSTVRHQLGIPVTGKTFEERYMLVDLLVDLDVANPRDYPYLSYFGDPTEWMIVVRLPHCWRLLFPLPDGHAEPTPDELVDKAQRFIGDVSSLELLGTNIYSVHHRVADRLSDGRVFLMGDAAHLITPMWALGLNTGVLDASNLPWRLAWVMRGWADPSLLDGYEREQGPLARDGAGRMAEAARSTMARQSDEVDLMRGGRWGVAMTRNLLGVSLDVEGSGQWGMIATGDGPGPIAVGDRAPDLPLHDSAGPVYLHDLAADAFVALYFTDTRRAPKMPDTPFPGLARHLVSRWDAPMDSGLRDRSLLDPGDRVAKRLGLAPNTIVLLRPDGHVAALAPFDPSGDTDPVAELYRAIVRPLPSSGTPVPHPAKGTHVG